MADLDPVILRSYLVNLRDGVEEGRRSEHDPMNLKQLNKELYEVKISYKAFPSTF